MWVVEDGPLRLSSSSKWPINPMGILGPMQLHIQSCRGDQMMHWPNFDLPLSGRKIKVF